MAYAVRAALVSRAPPIPDERLQCADKLGEDGVDVVQTSQQLDDVGTWVRVLFGEDRKHKGAEVLSRAKSALQPVQLVRIFRRFCSPLARGGPRGQTGCAVQQ